MEEMLSKILKAYRGGITENLILPIDMIKAIDEEKLEIRDLPLWAVDDLITYRTVRGEELIMHSVTHRKDYIDFGLEQAMTSTLEDLTVLQIIATGDMGYLPTGSTLNLFARQKYNKMRGDEFRMIKTADLFARLIYW